MTEPSKPRMSPRLMRSSWAMRALVLAACPASHWARHDLDPREVDDQRDEQHDARR